MSTWLALALPALPLQLARRALDPALARSLTLVIVDGPAQRSRVAFCNGKARAAGIAPGMKLAAAQALAPELVSIEHDAQAEHDALQELACWAYQFSARIVPFSGTVGSGLLIETGASERLFGGRDKLRRRIAAELHRLGYRAADAGAATPAAARLLAWARARGVAAGDALEAAQLPAALGRLPLQLLGWDERIITQLHTLGLQTIGQVLALPRDAFARRFGAGLLLDLDRLQGTVPDPQAPFAPPERFHARIELPADLIEVSRLLAPLERLLLLLEGFLRGQGAGATALTLRAHHPRRREPRAGPTAIPLGLAAPERDVQRLLRLFAERLARVRLPEPAIVLELQLERMGPWTAHSASFLPPEPGTSAQGIDALRLTETLHARLGSEGVFQLQALGDHRPEHAYRRIALSPDPPDQPAAPAPSPAQRPTLLLTPPRPLQAPAAEPQKPHYHGPLDLLAGPERIEAGWWDLGQGKEAAVHRDYFVARNRHGQTLWIYRELAAPHRWFLQGFFA
jgi:protein ImuB